MEYKMSALFNSLNAMSNDDDDNYYDDFDYVDDLLMDYLNEEKENSKCNGSATKSCAGKPSTKSNPSPENSNKSCDTGPVKYDGEGLNCQKCANFYPFSEPNQPDGSLICYSCRNFG